jgi:hypothetical protein
MATTAAVAPESQPSIGAMGRVVGALFSPKPTFADVARRPSFVAPLAILTILSLGVCYFMMQKIDWPGYMRAKAEKSSRFAQLTEDQKQQQIAVQAKFTAPFTYAFGLLGPTLFALILALVYWGAFNLLGGAGAKFGQAFGIVSHAFMPSAIASVLTMLTLGLKPFGQATPETMLASHLGVLLSNDAPSWQLSLLSSFDIFWIWVMVLLAIGFAAVNPKKLAFGKSLGIVIGVWLVWIVLKVGVAFIFS